MMKLAPIMTKKVVLVSLVSLLLLTILLPLADAQLAQALTTIRDKVVEFACTIYRIIQAIVGVIAVLMIILAGISWMTSDDPDSRTESKNRVLYVIVGVVVVLLALDAVNLFAKTLGIITTDITCPGPTIVDCNKSTLTTFEKIICSIRDVMCIVVRTLQAIAGIIAMIGLTTAGLKAIVADSPEGRAGAKKLALGVIVGTLVIIIGGQALSVLFSGAGATSFTCPGVSAYAGLQDIIDDVNYTVCIILKAIQFITGFVVVIAIMLAGIRWLSSDSPEDRAVAKKMVISAIIGFLIILAAEGLSNLFVSGSGLTFACTTSLPTPIEDILKHTPCVALKTLQSIAGIVAAMAIAFAGIKWMSSDDPDERAKAKRWIMNAIVGFLVVIMGAQALGTLYGGDPSFTDFSCGTTGTALAQVKATFCVILRTIQAVAAIIAAVVIGLAGLKWMTFDTDYEERNKAKGLAMHAIIGLLIVIVGVQFLGTLFASTVITSFTCGAGSALDFAKQPMCVMLNIIMAVAAIIAAIAFILAAFRWFIAARDPESRAIAKGAVFNVIVGFLIVVISVQFMNIVVLGTDIGQITCAGEGPSVAGAFAAPMCLILRTIQLFGVLIAMVVMLIAGIRWISLEDPDKRNEAKTYIFYSLLALIIVLLVGQFVNAMLLGATGLDVNPADITCSGSLDTGITAMIEETGCMVFGTMRLVAIILAVIVTLYVGIKLMSTDDPDERSRAKMILFNAMVGLVIVLLASSFLGLIITQATSAGVAPAMLAVTCGDAAPVEVKTMVEYIGCLFYWILTIVAIGIAILVISLAGLRWMFSDTPESRQSAKNMIIYAIVGTLVVLLAWQIIGSIMGESNPFNCSSFDNAEIKAKIQYTVCLFIYLIWYSVAGLATILIAIAGLIWMFAEDPETRTKAKWMIGHVIIGALIIMAAAFFINALVTYGGV